MLDPPEAMPSSCLRRGRRTGCDERRGFRCWRRCFTQTVSVQSRESIGPTTINIGVEDCYAWVVPSCWSNLDIRVITENVATVTSTTTERYLTVVVLQVGNPTVTPTGGLPATGANYPRPLPAIGLALISLGVYLTHRSRKPASGF